MVPLEVVETGKFRVAIIECAGIYLLSLCSEGEVRLGPGRLLVGERETQIGKIY